MPSTSGGQQKTIQLSERPTVHDISGFMTQAIKESGVTFNYAWRTNDGRPFILTVKHVSPTGKTCEWQLLAGLEGNSREIWSRLSDNTVQIYDSMMQFMGEDLEENTRKDGKDTFSYLPVYGGAKPAAAKEKFRPIDLAQTFDNMRFDGDMSLRPQEETLKGNLTLVHITNLLQSIGMGSMSGRLKIKRHTVWAEIYFEHGHPYHAVGTRGSGEDCLLQAICWMEGDFEFEPKLKSDEKTIVRSLDTIILEGVLLHDNTTYLTAAGVRMQTVLARVRPSTSEAEFDSAIQSGATVEARKLKAFYLAVDGAKCLEDIVTELGLLRSQWVPIVADLIRCNLIKLSSSKRPKEERIVIGKSIDYQLAETAKEGLLDKTTNVYTYAAFMLFLSEMIRCSHDHPLSIMLMEVQPAGSADRKVELTPGQIQELVWKIDEACNFKGIIAHYDKYDFAVILPGVVADKTARRADRLLKSLVSTGLQTGDKSTNLVVAIGIACHPDDAGDLGALLAQAEKAREKSRKLGSGVSMARPPSM